MTITLKQWNEATTEQRSQWLRDRAMIRDQDLPALFAQADRAEEDNADAVRTAKRRHM